jgi:DNA invertase Pin-like site-specific DNA recombinase
VLSAVSSENEREIIRERSRAGIEAARARGRIGSRPKGLSKEAFKKASVVASLYHQGKSISHIRETLNIGSNTTVYRYLRSEGVIISENRQGPENCVNDDSPVG